MRVVGGFRRATPNDARITDKRSAAARCPAAHRCTAPDLNDRSSKAPLMSRDGVKTGKALGEQIWSAIPPKADMGLSVQYFRFVPILLQNDFAHPSAQDRFKNRSRWATLIQKFRRPDSIVAYSKS